MFHFLSFVLCFFFTASAPTAFYTLSLHDALPICLPFPGVQEFELHGSPETLHHRVVVTVADGAHRAEESGVAEATVTTTDRKSTRLNSSHITISYAVFCLKKKKKDKLAKETKDTH